jgi:DNA-directed RNA polymerase subunit beta'
MESIGQSIIVTVTAADNTERIYTVKGSTFINVHNGDYVEAGDMIADGNINPHDILKIKGYHAAAILLLNEAQKVYRSQGVSVNCKHFEVVISKMLEMVRIDVPGDTNYIVGDIVPRRDFLTANSNVIGNKATAVFLLYGITKAALLSDSFLSSASFQRASSVLSAAAIKGKQDDLQSIKANVITGELIPVGTGYLQKNKR